MRKRHRDYPSPSIVTVSFILLLGGWLFLSLGIGATGPGFLSALRIRDNAEAVSALFTALAFGGLLWSLVYQRHELRLQRRELRLQRRELRSATAAQNASSEALKERLALEETLLRRRVAIELDREFSKATVNYSFQPSNYATTEALDIFLSETSVDRLGAIVSEFSIELSCQVQRTISWTEFEKIVVVGERLNAYYEAGLLKSPEFMALFKTRLLVLQRLFTVACEDTNLANFSLYTRVGILRDALSTLRSSAW